MKHMYRVSNDLRTEVTNGNTTTVLHVKEQCGCLYYFANIDNAIKAMKEFDTGIDVLNYDSNTSFSDDWYEG